MWLILFMSIIIVPLVIFGIVLLWRDYRADRNETVHAG